MLSSPPEVERKRFPSRKELSSRRSCDSLARIESEEDSPSIVLSWMCNYDHSRWRRRESGREELVIESRRKVTSEESESMRGEGPRRLFSMVESESLKTEASLIFARVMCSHSLTVKLDK